MARELRRQEVADAVATYCQLHADRTVSTSENGFTIMPGDILVSCQDGKLECNDPATKEALLEIITMGTSQEPAKAPNSDLPARRDNSPGRQRNGQIGQMAPIGKGLGNLSPQDIINYINPKATEQEAFLFCEFCRRKGADPMTKQVYLVIYEGQNGRQANFIAGKEYFTEKAEAHPEFDGFEAGIIVQVGEADHEVEYREGTFTRKGEALLGGWATVHRKDRKIPSKAKVALSEYATGKNLWAKMPATMIRKVAIVQALREAFPATFGGMYDRSEMDQTIEPDYEVK